MKGSTNYIYNIFLLLGYFLLIFTMLCGGNLHILGPFSLRHLCMFFLFGIAVLTRKKTRIYDKVWQVYLVYLAVYVICNVINGEIVLHSFSQSLFTYHIPCLAIILGLPALVKDINQVKLFVWAFIALYAIDSFLSYFQYINSSFAWAIAYMISSQAEEGMETSEMLAGNDNMFGYSVVAGVFGFVVTNGYFLSTYLPTITYGLNQKGLLKKLVFGSFLALGGVAIFITQQRMAFLSLLLFLCYLIWFEMRREIRVPLIIAAVLVLSYYGLNNIDLGRISLDHDDSARIQLLKDFTSFLESPSSLFGGAEEYLKMYGRSQHNSFLSSWVGGGFFTFVVYIFLFFKLVSCSVVKILKLNKMRDSFLFTISFAVSMGIFLLYSLTHSSGVQSGSPMFWFAYSMMCISYTIEGEKRGFNNK